MLERKGISDIDVISALRYLRHLIEPVNRESYVAFEENARRRLLGRDEEDWPVLATALAFSCPMWTEDADFFGTGVAVWTTSRVEIFLQELSEPPELDEQS